MPSHPLRGLETYIGAIAAEPDATRGQVLRRGMRHPYHVICASIAYFSTGQTSFNTVVHVLVDRTITELGR